MKAEEEVTTTMTTLAHPKNSMTTIESAKESDKARQEDAKYDNNVALQIDNAPVNSSVSFKVFSKEMEKFLNYTKEHEKLLRYYVHQRPQDSRAGDNRFVLRQGHVRSMAEKQVETRRARGFDVRRAGEKARARQPREADQSAAEQERGQHFRRLGVRDRLAGDVRRQSANDGHGPGSSWLDSDHSDRAENRRSVTGGYATIDPQSNKHEIRLGAAQIQVTNLTRWPRQGHDFHFVRCSLEPRGEATIRRRS
ncbi:unnamed protein product [Trichogramma brassicae]|uniref:Uncharacterized protein n=1 Tax=Trichogramma brassicae TaxID=86971 RepID=A0A6H5IKJ2_9HYME|nr:unnamed protein product [Trichogramma brassicae]